ncbi:MAG: neuraminidase-like domain-containing protein, partial [Candidatus Hodarchaeota archaeon]
MTIAGSYHDTNTDILYLIGRSKTEPYVFYHRRYEKKESWTPWEKIDLTINAELVSPVFAFRRLFVFWVETEKMEYTVEGAAETRDEKHKKTIATVKYSFYDLNGKWAQPQKFHEDEGEVDAVDDEDDLNYILPERIEGDKITLANINFVKLKELKLNSNLTISSPEVSYIIIAGEIYVLRLDEDSNQLRLEKETGSSSNNFSYRITKKGGEFLDEVLRNVDASNNLNKSMPITNNLSKFFITTEKGEYLAEGESVLGYKKLLIIGEIDELGETMGIAPGSFTVSVFGGSEHTLIFHDEIKAENLYLGEDRNLRIDHTDALSPYNTSILFQRIDSQAVNVLSPLLFADGIEKMLHTETQHSNLKEPDFNGLNPTDIVKEPYPDTRVDFEGPYGLYYRELFFHIPALIANHLSANKKFEEAQRWYNFIFNPAEPLDKLPNENWENSNGKYWRYLPFRKMTLQEIEERLTNEDDIRQYRENPFKPHAIAQERVNAYQKTIVMKYIDNLLDWGDDLFAQDTIESINEATNLYILASELLGKKPEKLDICQEHDPKTYSDIEAEFDAIPEFYIELENSYMISDVTESGGSSEGSDSNIEIITMSPYFCVPENETFLEYWNRVEKQLFKIRHCMNIKGIVRALPLYQPPISPMALVRAAASGLDISSVISEISGGRVLFPKYRFSYMIEKARNITSSVQQFGSALLSALEKKDAEELSVLRTSHEKNVQRMMLNIKEKQRDETIESIAALTESNASAKTRNKHYKDLRKKGLSSHEKLHLASMMLAQYFENMSNMMSAAASTAHLAPSAGIAGWNGFFKFGGENVGSSLDGIAKVFGALASYTNLIGSMSSTLGSYERRSQEWKLQEELAQHDIDQIDKQISAAQIRQQIAEKEIEIQEKTIEQTDEVFNFMKDKFTNKELYQWMTNQLSGL